METIECVMKNGFKVQVHLIRDDHEHWRALAAEEPSKEACERVEARARDLTGGPCTVDWGLLPEGEAKSVLKELGFTATKIPTSSEKSADFDVTGDTPGYLVEVKSRFLNERITDPPSPPEPKGAPVVNDMTKDAKVAEWCAYARKQFVTVDPLHEKLWMLWCSVESPYTARGQVERMEAAFYGIRRAVEVVQPMRGLVVYYARPSVFERFPDIDAAIVYMRNGEQAELGFCPNEASPRFDVVMKSKLVASLRALGVPRMLPSERVSADNGIVVPWSIDRRDEAVVLRYVQEASGISKLTFWAKECEYLDAIKVEVSGE